MFLRSTITLMLFLTNPLLTATVLPVTASTICVLVGCVTTIYQKLNVF